MIPKTERVERLQDCIPISLLNGPYKITVKILASRLEVVIDKVVNWNQSAFLKGRQTSENFPLAMSVVK